MKFKGFFKFQAALALAQPAYIIIDGSIKNEYAGQFLSDTPLDTQNAVIRGNRIF